MISSASSSDRAARAESIAAPGPVGPRPFTPRPDQISTEGSAFLRAELARQPEIRSEVVARARTLAADPAYPPPGVLRSIARLILASPDPSENES